ncbi:MAG: sigma-54-dependent transcriptional regulator [Polyangiaceae bacterium]|jgi:two-component system, NtrC family, response regulator HydG
MTDRILLVDDDRDHCEMLELTLRSLGHDVTYTTSAQDALERVGGESFGAVLTDLGMAEMGGIELCTRIIGTRPDAPVIVVTGNGSMEVAIDAMRAGAYDFLTKPIDEKLLGLSVARAVERHRLQVEVKRLREESLERSALDELIGTSPAMKRVHDLVARVGASDISVLIEGETGTGKELVARALHAAGPRRNGPFVAINCGAVPANLLESELFGHVRGAFTGANANRPGLIVKASGGTLLLDEIGEMPLDMQTKLLRALQERKIRPVGSNEERSFDARILAATNRNLEAEVAAKRFREDLFYRINVVKIEVPSLRARGSDILALATHFLRKASEKAKKGEMFLSPQVAAPLLAYDWPGNVRELENCIERAVALARLDHVSAEDLPEKVLSHRSAPFILSEGQNGEILTLEEVDRRYIARALKLLDGNKSRAADLLGLDRRTLYRRLEKYESASGREASLPE